MPSKSGSMMSSTTASGGTRARCGRPPRRRPRCARSSPRSAARWRAARPGSARHPPLGPAPACHRRAGCRRRALASPPGRRRLAPATADVGRRRCRAVRCIQGAVRAESAFSRSSWPRARISLSGWQAKPDGMWKTYGYPSELVGSCPVVSCSAGGRAWSLTRGRAPADSSRSAAACCSSGSGSGTSTSTSRQRSGSARPPPGCR